MTTTTIEDTWRQGWLCLCAGASLPAKGDQAGLTVMAEGIVAARTGDGGIATYVNACRHRGHELVRRDAVERRAVLRCAYHAWTYGLDGTLRKAPGFDDLARRELASVSLQAVRSAQWEGWVFVNLSGSAAPLAEWVAANAPDPPALPAGLRVAECKERVVPGGAGALVERFSAVLSDARAGRPVSDAGPFPELAGAVPGPGSGLVANLLAAVVPGGPVTYRLDPLDGAHTRLTCERFTAEVS